jgi:hypothetical protein
MHDGARVIKVIETNILRRGDGVDDRSPIRIITQYWSLDGDLLAECDPCSEVIRVEEPMYERMSAKDHRINQRRIRDEEAREMLRQSEEKK